MKVRAGNRVGHTVVLRVFFSSTLRNYSWQTQKTYGMLGIEHRSSACKARTLPNVHHSSPGFIFTYESIEKFTFRTSLESKITNIYFSTTASAYFMRRVSKL